MGNKNLNNIEKNRKNTNIIISKSDSLKKKSTNAIKSHNNDINEKINENTFQNEMEEKFYYALNHDIRRKLIRIIGEGGEGSFTQFKRKLKVSTGTLYHHLDVLKELLTQNEKKKYLLTKLGKHAYNFLIRNYDSLESRNIQEQNKISPSLKRFIVVVPDKLLERIQDKPKIGYIGSIFICFIFFIFVYISGVDSLFLFFIPFSDNSADLTPIIRLYLGIKFLVFILLMAIISEFLCRFLFGKKENTMNYLAIFAFGLFPMLIYLGIYNIFVLFLPLYVDNILNKLIMIIFTLWTIWTTSYNLIIFKYIKLERALLITFLVQYGSIILLLFAIL